MTSLLLSIILFFGLCGILATIVGAIVCERIDSAREVRDE